MNPLTWQNPEQLFVAQVLKKIFYNSVAELRLISTNFYYFGDQAISVPKEFVRDVFCSGRDMRSPSIPEVAIDKFISWLSENYNSGILYGDPTSWSSHLKK